jgi:regulator of sigma E protease
MRRVAGPQTPRRRLGIRFQGTPGGGQLIVAGVDPGSISEQAGFRAGDKIIAINDRPCEELDVNELGSLLGGASPLKFQLERNGESLVIDVQ